MSHTLFKKIVLPPQVKEALQKASITIPQTREEMLKYAYDESKSLNGIYEVKYPVAGLGEIVEATVTKCKNGFAVNYPDISLRRRDPDAMVIADDLPTDKKRFTERFGKPFAPVYQETLEWLAQQDLLLLPFYSGNGMKCYPSLLVAPKNAAFFVAGLADLQGFILPEELPDLFKPEGILYIAPPFRHTHFEKKQVVVHRRSEEVHELLCYNLYPGPSAKKGVYSILIDRCEQEGLATLHAAAVKVLTPYENEFVILHEGASGGGKSEMTEQIHRQSDGKILYAKDIVTKEEHYLNMDDSCELHPVADDMALSFVNPETKKLKVIDAENGWFLRVDHLTSYGKDPTLEKLTINPKEPLIFLNIDGKPNATALIWEHTEDSPGKPCSNPRVILPRHHIAKIVDTEVEVDVRSFGVRCPPTTKESPNFGIIGLMHILPPALAWLWRLAAPRGHANPSIAAGKSSSGLVSEGVGTYWPFTTGKMVTQANILLDLTLKTLNTKNVLIPNQYVGANHVGFYCEWIAREVMARRGNLRFKNIQPARCPLLGFELTELKVNGQSIPKGLLQVYEQLDVGLEAYDIGASLLTEFFKKEISKYLTPDLNPRGREIIEACLANATVEDYTQLIK